MVSKFHHGGDVLSANEMQLKGFQEGYDLYRIFSTAFSRHDFSTNFSMALETIESFCKP